MRHLALLILTLLPFCLARICSENVAVTSVSASAYQDPNVPANVLDGDLTTRWSGKGIGVNMTLDLGSLKNICSIGVAWYLGDQRNNSYTLATSADGITYSQVFSGVSPLSANYHNTTVPARSTRYVRLVFLGNSASGSNEWCSISEIKITAGFAHPGVIVNTGQLEFVKAKVASATNPWKSQYDKMKSNSRGSTSYTASPVTTVKCGQEKPTATDVGCSAFRENALAAWTQSLLFYHTADPQLSVQYATTAINILNAWSSTLQSIAFVSSDTSINNGALVAAWLAELLPRSAEILQNSGSWSSTDSNRFATMLSTKIQPLIANGWKYGNGNWDLSFANGLASIAVFTNNRTAFDKAISLWRARVPQYIYLATDGASPVPPCCDNVFTIWKQSYFNASVNGQVQEMCRDLGHTQMGLGSIILLAETAYQQGVNLYAEQQTRITTAMEFTAKYLNLGSSSVQKYLCNGTLNDVDDLPAWEIGYNHYVGRLGLSMPATTTLINRFRTQGPFYTNLQLSWDTITHAGTGWAGLP